MSDGLTLGQFAAAACVCEATARKVGNVHRTADFTDTHLSHFLLSAVAVGPAFELARLQPVGRTILDAVRRTAVTVRQNTNLGIVLLLAPLAAAADRQDVPRVLRSLSRADAADAFEAIRTANPGGLGDASEQDVRGEPTVTLLEAMTLAADRDAVARQYANDFADVFDFGVPALLAGVTEFGCLEAAIIACQLAWLAEFEDSLIARKLGRAAARDVQQRAAAVRHRGGLATAAGRAAGRELDAYLRSDGHRLNPGTTADLVTACLFVAFRDHTVTPSHLFPWAVPDWL